MKKMLSLGLVFVLMMSLSLLGQDTLKLKTLGRSPLTQPVMDASAAKQVVKNHFQEIGKITNDGFLFDLVNQIEKTEFRNESLPIGTKMRWMLFRDKSGNIRHITNVEWAGQEPILAFSFEITHNSMIYCFSVPGICGNICLLEIKKQPEKPAAPPTSLEPEKQIEEPKLAEPEQPKAIPQPIVTEQPLVAPKKHRPNIKIHAGPWIPQKPIALSLLNENVNVSNDFTKWLPEYEIFQTDPNSTFAQIYLSENYFPYKTGDSVVLKQQRSLTTNWSGVNFNVGIEIRAWKQLWLGIDYYRSENLHINVLEYTENMLFKEVECLGLTTAEQEDMLSCPPLYYSYLLELNRLTTQRQTDYTIYSQEIHLSLRYYLNIGRLSLAPSFGLADQQFTQKIKDHTLATVLYPFKDEVISESENITSGKKENNYQLTWAAGLTGEVKLLKFLSVAAEGTYHKFSEEQLIHQSTVYPNLGASFKSKPWRATAMVKIVF